MSGNCSGHNRGGSAQSFRSLLCVRHSAVSAVQPLFRTCCIYDNDVERMTSGQKAAWHVAVPDLQNGVPFEGELPVWLHGLTLHPR
jgi:hypothetical protein